jgi:hypothetical protein
MVPKTTILLRFLRIILGGFLVLSAIPALIQGGLSRYARIGIPAHPDWKWITVALVMLAVGLLLIRPFPWTSRRHN